MSSFSAYMCSECPSAQIYPAHLALLQRPKPAIHYTKTYGRLSLVLWALISSAATYFYVSRIEEFYEDSASFVFLFGALLLINTISLAFKIRLNLLITEIDLPTNPPPARREGYQGLNYKDRLMGVFKSRWSVFSNSLSLWVLILHVIAVPCCLLFWYWMVNSCLYLLIWLVIFSIKIFADVFFFKRSILLVKSYQSNNPNRNPQDNPYDLNEIIYKAAEAEDIDPKLKDGTCAICMGDFEDGDKLFEFICMNGHYFHQDCLNRWLGQKSICPLCKVPLY